MIKVLTWNVHKGADWLGRRSDLSHALDVLLHQGLDVVNLQEAPLPIVSHFAKRWNWSYTYVATRKVGRVWHCNAIMFSPAFRLLSSSFKDISKSRIESRCFLHAYLESMLDPALKLDCFCVHLGLASSWRKRQAIDIVDALPQRSMPTPILLAGDFNDANHGLEGCFSAAGLNCSSRISRAVTFPSVRPLLLLDRIYYSRLVLCRTRIPDGRQWHRFSDHLPFLGEFNWPSESAITQ